MHRQSSLSYLVSQLLFIGVLVIVCLTIASTLISVIGSSTALAANESSTTSANDLNIFEDSNMISNTMIAMGKNSSSNLKWMASSVSNAGKSMASSSSSALHSTINGVAYVGRGLGNAILFPFKLPFKVANSIGKTHPLQAVIRPSDAIEVPIINGQTSASILARYNTEQQKQIAISLAAQKSANKHLGGSIVAGDLKHGGYPAKWGKSPQDSKIDKWGMYNRECVSYAAWKVHQTFGSMPYWGGVGNANQWVSNAKAAGIKTGSKPKKHSVAISMQGYYGHAMWVEAVKDNKIYVSQFNYDLRGQYSEMWVKGSNLTYLYFK